MKKKKVTHHVWKLDETIPEERNKVTNVLHRSRIKGMRN
jgi:hypothetical protein